MGTKTYPEDGIVARVCKVGQQIIDGPGVCYWGLDKGAQHCHHSQPSILDFPCPQVLLLLRWALAPAQGVKPQSSRVPNVGSGEFVIGENRVDIDTARLDDISPSPALSPSHKDQLDDEEGSLVSEISGISGSIPWGCVQDAGLSESIGDEYASCAEHGPAAVHELGLDIPLQILGVRSCQEKNSDI